MATVFTVTHVTIADDVAVVQLLTDPAADIAIGDTVTLAALTNSALDGAQVVLDFPAFELLGVDSEGDPYFDPDQPHDHQLLFAVVTPDVTRVADAGTLTWSPAAVAWATNAMVIEFLGIAVATANDTAYITTVVGAANAWAYRKRAAAGYTDPIAAAPSDDVALGVTLYAASLYRARGSVEQYQTYDGMPATAVTNFGQILGLLGVNRSQVA
tara:strand:- start:220 stop:858 length:639 start_codon:yes stop_codon:yes gene_type:complete